MRMPLIARAITSCWISLVPSKIVWITVQCFLGRDVSAACKGAPTVAVATLANTTTHINTRILFIPKPATSNKPAGTAELLVIGWGTYLSI